MAFIYKIINDINEKVYIGKTIYTIEDRWREHKSNMNKRAYEHRPLYSAMRKYGVEHFDIQQLEECDLSILSEREMYWIKYYDSYSNGYNATLGGDGKAYADTQLILNLWNQGKLVKEISQITGYCVDTVSAHLKNNGINTEEIHRRIYNKNCKPVAMLDKNTEEVICIFSSTEATLDFLQKEMSKRHVREVCLGQRKTAYGYKWKYVKDLNLDFDFDLDQ